MKRFLLTCLLSISFFINAQIKSPEQFLGYSLGNKFTYHDRIIAYCRYIANESKDKAIWHIYGKTNEDREQGQLIIASPRLINQLDTVIQRHQSAIHSKIKLEDAIKNLPVIINLSFNVHGNEAAGSEASLQLIFNLLSKPEKLSQFTRNKPFIILIDPCINPDGREAYVTQFNRRNYRVGGNPDPLDQEHFEGQISGRYNHFAFDLNRDWIWKTQKETQNRLEFYHTWLPMLHADFHEQGYQNSYYFPPAVKPYLNSVPNSTKELQTSVGKAFSQLFDKNHWTYFTSEIYDLLYPGYGDTYPILNGALGMTLEQGGIRGGLQAFKKNGDTITLADRINHHATLGYELIKWSLENGEQVKQSFYQNQENARVKPKNEFKTYLIPENQIQKSKELLALLTKNKIEFGSLGKSIVSNAYSYDAQKFMVNQKFSEKDLIISAYQNSSPLIQTLLDPVIELEDSLTYDITAWNQFQIHGISAYGLKEKWIPVINTKIPIAKNASPNLVVGAYLLPSSNADFFQLIQKAQEVKIETVFNDIPVEVDGISVQAGHIWFLKTKISDEIFNVFLKEAFEHKITLNFIQSFRFTNGADVGSRHFKPIKTANIAVVVDTQIDFGQQGELAYYLTQKLGLKPTFIPFNQLFKSQLFTYSHLIFPSGDYTSLSTINQVLLNDWTKKGGILLLMEDAIHLLDKKMVDADFIAKDDTLDINVRYELKTRTEIANTLSGNLLQVNLDSSHPFMFRIENKSMFIFNQFNSLYKINKSWNTLINTGSSPILNGFMGMYKKKLLPHSMLLSVKEVNDGKIIWFGFNPIFRGIPAQAQIILENTILYSQY